MVSATNEKSQLRCLPIMMTWSDVVLDAQLSFGIKSFAEDHIKLMNRQREFAEGMRGFF